MNPLLHHSPREWEEEFLFAKRSLPIEEWIHPNFFEINVQGKILERPEVLLYRSQMAQFSLEIHEFQTSEIPGGFLNVYHLIHQQPEKQSHSQRTSVWIQKEPGFQIRSHHATRIPT